MKEKIKKIIVNCEENDIVDIKCGGPRFLGYDFFVNESESKDIINFIKEKLKEFNQPLLHIFCIDIRDESVELWSKDKISECIKKGY